MDVVVGLTAVGVIVETGPGFITFEEWNVFIVGFQEAGNDCFPLKEVSLVDWPKGVYFLRFDNSTF